MAVARPAGPPPTMRTSYSFGVLVCDIAVLNMVSINGYLVNV